MSKNKELEKDCWSQKALLESVFDAVGDPVMAIGLDHRLLWMNEAAGQVMAAEGRGPEAFCHEILYDCDTPCEHGSVPCSLAMVRSAGQRTKFLHQRQDADGVIRQFEVVAMPLRDDWGELVGVVKTMRDITEHRELLSTLHERGQMLEARVSKDPLTGLANRELAMERIGHAIALAHRNRNQLGLLFIDLNQFKKINDTCGHEVGDQVLLKVAERLNEAVREGDTVARLGGDEFVVLLDRLASPEGAAVLGRKLLAALRKPMQLEAAGVRKYEIGASIGISIYPRDGKDAETLLRNADTAMYRAKRDGADKPQFFSEALTREDRARLDMEHCLRRALNDEGESEFFLLYQPVVDLVDGRIDKVEALLRWNHPEFGIVAPDRFLPVAEESGLIQSLDEWVLFTACSQFVEWREKGFGLPRISVNLSGRQLVQRDFPRRLASILDATDCPGTSLELELNEASLMTVADEVRTVLAGVRELGVAISVDDFGTGYTSLSHLRLMPITQLKLDRSLVSCLPAGGNEAAVARAVMALSASMQFKVVAEGIENEAQRDFLIAEGCRQGQGYLYSQPMRADALADFLRH